MDIGDKSSYLPTFLPPTHRLGLAAAVHADPSRQADLSRTQASAGQSQQKLSAAEQRQVRELQARDREVRAHEQAHLSAAGPHARGGPSYTYQVGPDGRRYAVGGEVHIDASPIPGDPHATLDKARIVQRAALAPAEPSAQDRAVAAAASRMAIEAQADIALERRENQEDASRPGRLKSLQTYHAVSQQTLASDAAGKHVDLLA